MQCHISVNFEAMKVGRALSLAASKYCGPFSCTVLVHYHIDSSLTISAHMFVLERHNFQGHPYILDLYYRTV